MPIEDKELLRSAWPSGYLPMKGTSTIGGWMLLEILEDGHPVFVHPYKNSAAQWQAMEAGDLLPVIDHLDTVNWAAAVHDLAKLMSTEEEKDEIHSATLVYAPVNSIWARSPFVLTWSHPISSGREMAQVETEDDEDDRDNIEHVLVKAIARHRELEKKGGVT